MKERTKNILMLTSSMVIFGTIGVFRRYINLPSATIAFTRGVVGAIFLLVLVLLRGKRPDFGAVRRNLVLLLLSGAAMGLNWILLFEAYNYTSVAMATLCYYMAPTFIILASPLVLRERLTPKKILCVVLALIGMVFISGVLEAGFTASELKGAAFGLGAAVLYAVVILLNKRLKPIGAYDKTMSQLLIAAVVLSPYLALTGGFSGLRFDTLTVLMLGVLCLIHTGLAYALYFGCMDALPAQSLALFSYIDPVVAVLLSAFLLKEPISAMTVVGAVLVLGSAVYGELPEKRDDRAGHTVI